MRTNLIRIVLPGVLGLLLLPLGLAAQSEGYDPMLQVTHQFAHPNVLLVVDLSASMGCDLQAWAWPAGMETTFGTKDKRTCCESIPTGVRTGQYTNLNGSWMAPPIRAEDFAQGDWVLEAKDSTGKYGAFCSNGASSLQYRWRWHDPSRMATLKNILGSSVTITALNQKMLPSHAPTAWSTTIASKPAPLDTKTILPRRLVAASAQMVNWGLMAFSCLDCHSEFAGNYYNDNLGKDPAPTCQTTNTLFDDGCKSSDNKDATAKVMVPINTDDSDVAGQDLNRQMIEAYLAPTTTVTTVGTSTIRGFETYTATPTPCALKCAKDYFSNTVIANDTKDASCGRRNFVILITDGQSTIVDGGHNISACGNVMPWDAADTLYTATKSDPRDGVRTFVVGLSTQVTSGTARDELNHVAFHGKTDATQDKGGINLPSTDPNWATFDSSKNYAYFATNADELASTLADIIASVAAGDYTTSAPVASSALSTGTVALLASAEFPGWKGHLYAYDVTHCDLSGCNTTVFPTPDCDHCTGTAADPIPAPPVFLWDAGTVLNSTSAASRKIYTWNSSNQLVEVTAANAGTLNSICGSCGITSAVVDFIRGNDGSGNARSWKLGSVVNSTPAVTQAVEVFRQGNLADHSAFESKYATRTPLVWVGADDGMLHAFKLSDGSEVLALLPPNLLSKQVLMKANYDPSKRPTGQPSLVKDHIYGVAGSPRYGDVWFSSDSKYKTVLILTEGPGGDLVAGIDVTSPVTGDPGSYDPVILWSKTGADIAGLFKTWSTPSGGADTYNTWKGIMGAGFNPASTKSAQVNPKVFLFNPVDGSVSYTGTLGSLSSPSPWVGNQSFCDSVIYQMSAKAYYPDNKVTLGLQPDLNGRIWFIPGPSFASASVGIDATAKAGQQQPIYYPPAVSGYQNYDIYAFGSGTFYETAFANDSRVGLPSGDPPGFSPSLYLVAKDQTAGAATSSQILRITINQDLYVPEDLSAGPDPLHPSPCSLPANQYLTSLGQTLCTLNTPVKLGQRTQLTAPPALFVPVGSSGSPVAVFLLYDPDTSDCAGTSYIVKLSFDIVSGAPHVKSTDVYGAGSGAASGFAVAGSAVVVAKSGVGSGSQASISKVPGLNPTEGLTNPTPVWWREVK